MHKPPKTNKNLRHNRRRRLLRALILLLGLGTSGTIAAVAGVIGAYYFVAPGLPEAETIRDIPLQIPLRIFSRDGHLISEIGERRRIIVTFEDLPPQVVHAFISAEDRRFFEHPGIDYQGIVRSFARLLKSGEISGGGSTLTQQLARDYFLTREQLFTRKLREAFLAYKIEQEFTKEQIMALFLNKMFFGQRAYGVAAAAQVYFNKSLQDVNAAEAATLAGVLPAPSRYNPVYSAANAEMRRGYVLDRMYDLGYLDDATFAEAMAFPMESQLHGAAVELNAPYVAEMVRSEMLKRYGEDTYTAGYQVVTTLDSRLQTAANYALRNGLLEFTRRRGYRGPVMKLQLNDDMSTAPFEEWPDDVREILEQYAPGGLSVALVTSLSDNNSAGLVFSGGVRATLPWRGISWAKSFVDRETTGPAPEAVTDVLSVGDIIYVMPTAGDSWALAQVPEAQGAVVSMDPYDGAVGALAGGFDFTMSKFNRARQAYRQPGSSFKPFIYSAALEHGNTPATVVLDAPVVINSAELEAVWRPINYSGRFYGPTRMREALVRSMNLVSVRLLLFETGVGNAVRHIEKFGFGDAALPHNGSLALGAGAASPLDMAQGYSVIANGGHAVKPYVIDAIYGPDGETLYRSEPAIVCDACVAEEANTRYRSARRQEMTLDAMADVAIDYRPDANTAPELFQDIVIAQQTVSPQNMFLVQDMMRDVVRRGTGRRAMILGRNDLSGKTGTSNDRRDAWFGGFNGDLASVVWVGYDDDRPLGPGEEGSRTALPIWVEFSRIALAGVPENQMPMPEGIVSVLIDRETGCPARSGQRDVVFEVFRASNVPDCEFIEEIPNIFNNASGIDAPRDPDDDTVENQDDEPLF
ncbi:MAG: PBP1A family penicillin-binding protein [Gammaproteobacteria bacterium]|nr:PBP1A family penicillin-binding protein [Gammaproteobacteria bacterium]NNL49918.1 PBP1A family penicillin-binding protein [Woeseiaceae bacterium]